MRLVVQNDMLVSYDGSISISLDPETIKIALEQKKIFPSMLSVYTLISLYYGMKCL